MNTSASSGGRRHRQANGHKIDRLLKRRSPEPSAMPRMHWRWHRRGRDINAILNKRCGGRLPDDDAGREYLQQVINHWIRIARNGTGIARANARLNAPWITVPELDALIESGLDSLNRPPISAAKLGKAFRATVDEVNELELKSITAFIIIQRDDADRQRRRRRKAGASEKRGRRPGARSEAEKATRKGKQSAKSSKKHRASKSTGKRGRRPLNLSPEQKKAHTNALAAERMRKKRAAALRENPCSKNRHGSSLYKSINRDELSVTEFSVTQPKLAEDRMDVHLIARGVSMTFGKIDADLKKAA